MENENNEMVGYDNTGVFLYVGDNCSFNFKGEKYTGRIDYDTEKFAYYFDYAFNENKEPTLNIYMHMADWNSIKKIEIRE